MKINVKLLKIDPKITDKGLEYFRIETSAGWMSCFDRAVNDKIKQNMGNCVEFEIIEKDNGKGGVFRNITGFVGMGDETKLNIPIQSIQESKKDFGTFIGKELPGKNATMYVSYAKDLFIALSSDFRECKDGAVSWEDVMSMCIKLVKQAKLEFE